MNHGLKVVGVIVALLSSACIEPPPSEQAPNTNNSTNNTTLPTNNANSNNSNNSTNTNSSTNSNNMTAPEFEPFRVGDGLELFFDFESRSPDGFENSGLGGVHFLNGTDFVAEDGEVLVQGAPLEVGFLDDIFSKVTESKALTMEIWWRPINSTDREVMRFGDRIFVEFREDRRLRVVADSVQMELTDTGSGFYTHLSVVITEDDVRVYIDGLLVGARLNTGIAFDDLGVAKFSIGPSQIETTQVAIYSRALTQAEIAMHTWIGTDLAPIQDKRPDLFVETYRENVYNDNLRKDFEVVSVSPEFERNGFLFGESELSATPLWRVPLAFEDYPRNARALRGYARLQGFDVNAGGAMLPAEVPIEVWALQRPWLANEATWLVASTGDEWAEAGVKGVEDRGESPISTSFYTFPNEFNHEVYMLFRLDSLVDTWFSGNNHGLLFEHSEILRGGLDGRNLTRPAMVFFGLAEPEEVGDVEINVQTQASDCQIRSDGIPLGAKLEVWNDEGLVGITSGQVLQVPECDPQKLRFNVMDVFGNRVSVAASM